MRDFLKDKDIVISIFRAAYQALEEQWTFLVTEVTSEVWRRDEQLYDLRSELSLQILRGTFFCKKHKP